MNMPSGSNKTVSSDEALPSSMDNTSDEGVDTNEESNILLKKGPWTAAEDEMLTNYVKIHGEGNWNAVQKYTTLARCGKSCRLRWVNHLRSDLKKGPFTQEEERKVIELHSMFGNKWARMAAELPGRTDNEIKNFWNTRTKRLERSGLPTYPPDIRMRMAKENQLNNGSKNLFMLNAEPQQGSNVANILEVPNFKALELNSRFYSTFPLPNFLTNSLLDIEAHKLVAQGNYLNSSTISKPYRSAIYPSKRFRHSVPLIQGFNTDMGNALARGSPLDDSQQIGHPLVSSLGNGCNPTGNCTMPSSILDGSDNHAVLYGNPSSEPTQATKLELPSLQTQNNDWVLPMPPLIQSESVNDLIQTPPIEHHQLPENSGLLDAILHESEAAKNSAMVLKSEPFMNTTLLHECEHVERSNGNNHIQQPHPPEMATEDMFDIFDLEFDAEELYALCQSSPPIPSPAVPPLSATSFDDILPSSAFSGLCQLDDKVETTERTVFQGLSLHGDKVDSTEQTIFQGPLLHDDKVETTTQTGLPGLLLPDEKVEMTERMVFPGLWSHDDKVEMTNQTDAPGSLMHNDKVKKGKQSIFSRPDLILASYFTPMSDDAVEPLPVNYAGRGCKVNETSGNQSSQLRK